MMEKTFPYVFNNDRLITDRFYSTRNKLGPPYYIRNYETKKLEIFDHTGTWYYDYLSDNSYYFENKETYVEFVLMWGDR